MLLIGTAPYVVATHPQKPFKTLADVIAAAKTKPDTVSYGSVGSGSIGHLAMVLLRNRRECELVHVPYRGGGPAMNDAIAGHVDLLIGSAALSTPQIQAGGITAGRADRQGAHAGARATVPTVGESGFAGFEAYAWWGVFAPAGTPKPIIDRFRTALAETACASRASQAAHRDAADHAAARRPRGAAHVPGRADADLGRGGARARHQGRLKPEGGRQRTDDRRQLSVLRHPSLSFDRTAAGCVAGRPPPPTGRSLLL